MGTQILKKNIQLLGAELKEILGKGAKELKLLYFQLGITIEEQGKNIGVESMHLTRGRMRVNDGFSFDFCTEKENLTRNCPNVKYDELLEVFKEYSLINESTFFNKLENDYNGYVGLKFHDNEVNFENIELDQEFKLYKAKLKKEKLEKELSNRNLKAKKKVKI